VAAKNIYNSGGKKVPVKTMEGSAFNISKNG